VVALTLVGAAAGLAIALPAIKNPDLYFVVGRLYVWGHTAFLLVCGAGAGVLVAGLVLAAWDRWRRPLTPLPE
jgi:hypothetical protein